MWIGQLYPITFYRIVFTLFYFIFWSGWVGVSFWCGVSLCVPFTYSLIKFYFMIIAVTIITVFMAILFILNHMTRLFITK